MAKKSDSGVRPWLLFLAATLLLTGGWVMKSFPVFIFAGIAPLFALAHDAGHDDTWFSTELILVALSVGLFGANLFDITILVSILSESIVLTLCFIGYRYVRQNLSAWPGVFTIIIFWLGAEHVFLMLPVRGSVIYLADAVQLKAGWSRWSHYLGYLSVTGWILLCNLLLFEALLKKDRKPDWRILSACFILIIGPIVASYWMKSPALDRQQMLSAYQGKTLSTEFRWKQGEIISRTSAILSALILIVTFIKRGTQKTKT